MRHGEPTTVEVRDGEEVFAAAACGLDEVRSVQRPPGAADVRR
ncbi:hypothetical protein [Dactylosporangium sp. NPDC050588]